MKLSNRKQLLAEADVELNRMQKLAGLLKEDKSSDFLIEAMDKQTLDKLEKLQQKMKEGLEEIHTLAVGVTGARYSPRNMQYLKTEINDFTRESQEYIKMLNAIVRSLQ